MSAIEPAMNAFRESLPSIQQNIESAFASLTDEPGLPVHLVKDLYTHREKGDKESKVNKDNQGNPHYPLSHPVPDRYDTQSSIPSSQPSVTSQLPSQPGSKLPNMLLNISV